MFDERSFEIACSYNQATRDARPPTGPEPQFTIAPKLMPSATSLKHAFGTDVASTTAINIDIVSKDGFVASVFCLPCCSTC